MGMFLKTILAAAILLALGLQACDGLRAAVGRRQLMQRGGAFFGAMVTAPAIVAAKETAGTKDDKAFTNCLGRCVYECTKPPSQMSRVDCYPGCKKQCATTDQQLLLGKPKA